MVVVMEAILPDTVTPEQLAERMGWSPRRVKALARAIGACRILGNRMVLTRSDVGVIMLASKPNMTVEDVREWLGDDAAEQHLEAEFQGSAERTGVVYFIQRGDEVKIGFSKDLGKRLTNLRTATTEPMNVLLSVPAAPMLEGYFHDKFAELRIEREWFKASEELLNFIARRGFGR